MPLPYLDFRQRAPRDITPPKLQHRRQPILRDFLTLPDLSYILPHSLLYFCVH